MPSQIVTVGTVNYVRDEWSPVTAAADCLGSGDDDIDREGRCVSSMVEFSDGIVCVLAGITKLHEFRCMTTAAVAEK